MSEFGEAFKKARAAGKKVFSFNGKSFHTKTKEEVETTSKVASGPKARPVPMTPTKAKAEVGTLASIREGNRAQRTARTAARKAKRDAAAAPKPPVDTGPKKPSRDFSEESKKKLKAKLGFK